MQIEDITLRRFHTKIRNDIVPLLTRPNESEQKLATLGLTALVLIAEGGMSPEDADTFVIDSAEDMGIDGIYFNSITKTLHIVQAKFRTNQEKTIDQGEAIKLKYGIERILKGDISSCNKRVQIAYERIKESLSDINTRIKICIACTGKQNLPANIRKIFVDFCKSQNEIDEIFFFSYSKFNDLFQSAKFFSLSSKTDINLKIYSYGAISEPYKAYFGYVTGADVAAWVTEHGRSLFEPNVRFTLHDTDVNESILYTIKHSPGNFWYFDNGITAIAEEATPAPADGNPKALTATAMSIVNGAQTAGMLARAADESIDLSKIKVPFRVISLSGAAPGLDEEITRANNTQNELNPLDFVSLDPRQDLLRTELQALGYNYIFKRGSENDGTLQPIEVKDAAIALACANPDISVSVQAKRYVSGLWKNIKEHPYTTIFHPGLNGQELLLKWKAYKKCEETIRSVK